MRLSLIIPCYNEARNLPLLLERCKAVARPGSIEVILVNNGSTDDSATVLERLLPDHPGCRSVNVDVNRGYGFGILTGLRAASGEILGWTHADMQTDPNDALVGLSLFDRHGDDIFVKGARHGRPAGDVVFTMGMSVFETILLGVRLWDINAQPTMFSRRFFDTWHNPPNDFSLDLYAFYRAREAGLDVHRFPVLFADRAHGTSHWNVGWAAKRKFIERTIGYSLELKRGLKKGK